MPDKNNKFEDNIKGAYYVDKDCIACDACCLTAPLNFKINEEDGHSFVFKQPTTEEEKEQCLEALEVCPVEAIGDDG